MLFYEIIDARDQIKNQKHPTHADYEKHKDCLNKIYHVGGDDRSLRSMNQWYQ